MSFKFDLAGKNLVVTGGASGIGWALVQELQRTQVNKIFILDVTVKTLNDPRVVFIKTDVTNDENFNDSFNACVQQCGRIDVMVNNAGVLRERDPKLTISINLSGTIHGSLLAVNHMATDRGGCGGTIINIASILGLDKTEGYPIYGASKFGVVGFSQGFDKDYFSKTQVRMLVLCPGITITNLFSDKSALDKILEEKLRKWVQTQPEQKVDFVARAIVQILNKGDAGSIWVAENEELYQVEMPSYKTLPRKQILM